MILKCNCQHEYQDRKHGKGKRVFNKCVGGSGVDDWRCTVCEAKKTTPIGARDK